MEINKPMTTKNMLASTLDNARFFAHFRIPGLT